MQIGTRSLLVSNRSKNAFYSRVKRTHERAGSSSSVLADFHFLPSLKLLVSRGCGRRRASQHSLPELASFWEQLWRIEREVLDLLKKVSRMLELVLNLQRSDCRCPPLLGFWL